MLEDKIKKTAQGGYSELMLQPCYLVGTGIIFLMTPFLGLFISSVIVICPGLYIARKIAKRQNAYFGLLLDISRKKLGLYINIFDLIDLLRKYKRNISSEILAKNLNLSHKSATILTEELILAGLASKKKDKSALKAKAKPSGFIQINHPAKASL